MTNERYIKFTYKFMFVFINDRSAVLLNDKMHLLFINNILIVIVINGNTSGVHYCTSQPGGEVCTTIPHSLVVRCALHMCWRMPAINEYPRSCQSLAWSRARSQLKLCGDPVRASLRPELDLNSSCEANMEYKTCRKSTRRHGPQIHALSHTVTYPCALSNTVT